MFTEFKDVPFSIMKLASKEELEVIRAYNQLRDISISLSQIVKPQLHGMLHGRIETTTEEAIRRILMEALKVLAMQFQLLRMPYVEFDVFTIQVFHNTVGVDIVKSPLREILMGTYGLAADFETVYAKLQAMREEQERKEQDEYEREQQLFLQTHLRWTRLPKSDYKQTDPLKTIAYTPTALRASGLIPPGYELVPIPVLDALAYAGMNTYDTAVGGREAEKQINQCANAAYNILKRHPNGGKKCK